MFQVAAQPNVIYNNNSPEYSIHFEQKIAQINNLIPEIKINGKWVSTKDFKNSTWQLKEGKRLSVENSYTGKIDYLYLICEGHPLVANFTLQFEIMKGRLYLVMNSTLQAAKAFKLGGIRLFTSKNENIVLPGNSKDWINFNESVAAPHTGALMYPYQLGTKKAKEGSFSKADTGVWLSIVNRQQKVY